MTIDDNGRVLIEIKAYMEVGIDMYRQMIKQPLQAWVIYDDMEEYKRGINGSR
jgi:hypothetical protein